ncbi:MAG: glutathione S-transferase [Halioglobus sp.]|jgi:glutathione S-transferase
MKIYSFPTFNAGKILLTAEELGLEYEWVQIDLSKGEHKSEEHLARHPMGKVPVLEYEGQYYIESNSICRLLARLNGDRLYSSDAATAARIDAWVDTMASHTGRWLGALLFEETVKAKFMGVDPDPKTLDEAHGYLTDQLPLLEKTLAGHAYLAGDSLTIADTIAANYFYTTEFTTVDLSTYPSLAAWYQGIRTRPSFERMLALSPTGAMVPFAK